MSKEFYGHFLFDDICKLTDYFRVTCFHLWIISPKILIVLAQDFFCKVLRLERAWCFCFLHLNLTISWSFFIWWQACRSSGFADIPVSDNAWHKDCSKTLLAISDDTGLILKSYIERYLRYCIVIELYARVDAYYNVFKLTD